MRLRLFTRTGLCRLLCAALPALLPPLAQAQVLPGAPGGYRPAQAFPMPGSGFDYPGAGYPVSAQQPVPYSYPAPALTAAPGGYYPAAAYPAPPAGYYAAPAYPQPAPQQNCYPAPAYPWPTPPGSYCPAPAVPAPAPQPRPPAERIAPPGKSIERLPPPRGGDNVPPSGRNIERLPPPRGGDTVPPAGQDTMPPVDTGAGDTGAGATGTGDTGGAADTGGPGFGGLGSGLAGGENTSATLYIDSAIPRTQIRTRFDAEYNINRPDRGEFYYPKCGCFMTPNAKGPPLPERRVDSDQEYSTYLEFAPSKCFSAFVEAPYRFINPEDNANNSGFGDINAGLKYAFVYTPCRVLTAQVRAYAPTADGRKGLGTRHTSVEPSFLFYQRLAPRLFLEGEVRDWIPIGGSDFESNVIRYGVGVSYLAYNGCRFRVQPVAEVVGWTFIGGKEFSPELGDPANMNTRSANGDTIVNAKLGTRIGFGDLSQPGFLSGSDLGFSYGRAMTGAFLYKEIIRAEYRMRF